MPAPYSARGSPMAGVAPLPEACAELLKLQLEQQKEMLKSQQRTVELQEQLIAALLANPSVAVTSASEKPLQPTEDSPSPPQIADPGVSACDGIKKERLVDCDAVEAAKPGAEDTQKDEIQEFLDLYDLKPEGVPWMVSPPRASIFSILKLSMFNHPFDLAVCFPDQAAFFEAAEAAMSPGRFRDFLVTSLELRLLFQSLLLSITVPSSLSQATPVTTLDLIISVFTFLLGVLNTIGVCLCIFATGILSSVSENNFTSWLHANYRFVHAALSSQCAMVPMILFLQAACQIRTQLSVDWLESNVQTGLCAVQIAMIVIMMTVMLFATNAAGRTAAFSGAMGEAAVPSGKSIFSSTVGGNRVGLFGMKKYLAAVMDGEPQEKAKKKTLLHKQGEKKVNIKKFDIAVF
eukprot:TRINITY_DN14087_c0_g1_i2.p1 TRINITY_DN14087_c0_g1~~TRINITY_DN14087_c0_g1_i2.p1  ORF type:complete len:405 (+),score=53.22 TRINITY_DN14087_c0_g1_i2:85-1299(+)